MPRSRHASARIFAGSPSGRRTSLSVTRNCQPAVAAGAGSSARSRGSAEEDSADTVDAPILNYMRNTHNDKLADQHALVVLLVSPWPQLIRAKAARLLLH